VASLHTHHLLLHKLVPWLYTSSLTAAWLFFKLKTRHSLQKVALLCCMTTQPTSCILPD